MSEKNVKCIWMEAGVVDYQLCQLNYNCDACDFHSRITQPDYKSKNDYPQRAKTVAININSPKADSFRAGIQYYPNHIWIKHIGRQLVIMGLDDMFFTLWDDISQIITKDVNSVVETNNSFAWLIIPGGLVNLLIPFAGKVVEINPLLTVATQFNLEEFQELPLNQRWILKMEPVKGELNRSAWLTKQQYIKQLIDDTKIVHSSITSEYENRSITLPTMSEILMRSHRKTYKLPNTTLQRLVNTLSRGTHQFH
ncbi:MAG: hypothetical protein KAK01_08495 [Candidatus Marinimicrobia bacterium]|nr:hypothetical protein [Candidatus Neomarinimicrobiota bacterium]